jgi:2-polyprenyl-3-methyl-5-hydroxy-6-metoxy-1,4-benzoquinol methylase
MPADAQIKEFYNPQYFEKDHSCGVKAKQYFQEEDRVARKAEEALQLILKYKSRGKLLEIGCAGGLFLQQARQRGLDVMGLELAPEIAEEGTKRYGLRIEIGDFQSHSLPEHEFDVVSMFDVFEHFPRPVNILHKVKNLLRTSGILFIDIPTTKNGLPYRLSTSLLNRLGKRRIFQTPPYHLFEYTPDTLGKMITQAGLNILFTKKYATPPWVCSNGHQGKMANALLGATRWVNYALASTMGVYSDRLIVIASKEGEQQ